MINRSLFLILLFIVNTITNTALADPGQLWTDVFPIKGTQARNSTVLPLLPDSYRLLQLDETVMRDKLVSGINSHSSNTLAKRATQDTSNPIELPLPDGKSLTVWVRESQTLAPALASKYPTIKTYNVEATDNNGIYGSIDLTDRGFHAMLFMQDGSRLFVDPRRKQNQTFYISYYDKDYHPADKKRLQCELDEPSSSYPLLSSKKTAQRSTLASSEKRAIVHKSLDAYRPGKSLKTYRLAMAATAEYTDFHGGTVIGALSAITTTVNRVNVIYQRDLAVKLELIANTDLLISTNPNDYNNFDGADMLDQNQQRTDRIIGVANYDIGHVVSTGGGGIARLAATCGKNKARGVTGNAQPVNDAFDIDFVAHEIGHQLGGRHTFNSETLNCGGGNRTPDLAIEPGSGSTILAYAGLCGDNDVQPHTDAAFHIESIQEISRFINDPSYGAACGTSTAIDNNPPSADAGNDYIIPANTPFELTGAASDPDKDTLSYSWEQLDVGDASDINVDTLNNAIFRVFLPTNNPVRTFPRRESLLEGKMSSRGEILPSKARRLNFALAVRDGNGGIGSDAMTIEVVDSAAFKITSHNSPATLSAGETTLLTWDVANTDSAPINCRNVNIMLSTDGGKTFNVSGNSTPNDGRQLIKLPGNIADSSNARFKVKCSNNIFFDISDADILIKAQLTAKDPVLSNAGTNKIADPGEAVQVVIPLRNNEEAVITNINSLLSSPAQDVSIPVASSSYPDITANASVNNTTAFVVNFPASATCRKDFPLILNTRYTLSSQVNKRFETSIPLGIGVQTNNDSQPIPDNDTTGISLPVTVSGFGVVAKPEINLDVDIVHSFRGDLELELTSPQGTTVRLSSFDGRNSGTKILGNYPGNLIPEQSLSAFDGENMDGVWTLKIVDSTRNDTGTFNSWSLNIKSSACDGTANSTPVANNAKLALTDTKAVSGLLPASDADNDPLMFTLVSNGTKGTVVITDATTGAFTYTPVKGQTGQDSFVFNVSDGKLTSNNAIVNVTISSKPNVAPVANASSITTVEATAVTGVLTASDEENDHLTYQLVTTGTKGIAVITNPATGAFTYTPNAGQTGQDSFSFNVSDGSLSSANATVTITITPKSAFNSAPVASNFSLTTSGATPVTGILIANDADNDSLTYSLVSNATKGSVVITNTGTGAFIYTPQTGQSGTDSFSFNASDGKNSSNTATVNITISAKPNAIPVAKNSSITTQESKAISGKLLATDADNDPLTYTLITTGSLGKAVITNEKTGAFTYTPLPGKKGKDTFTFIASDGKSTSGKGIIDITITEALVPKSVKGIEVAPYAYLYGKASFGKQTAAKQFTITNTSAHAITITASEIVGTDAGQFAILSDTCSNERLSGNSSCAIGVSFQPTSRGSKSAQLKITSDDPVNGTTLVFLSNHESDEEESARRLPPIMGSFRILDSANIPVTSMKAHTQYTLEWSISGYHPEYVSSVSMYDCTGITDEISCGKQFAANNRFLLGNNIKRYSVTNDFFSNLGVKSRKHHFRYRFTTPDVTKNTPIVIRLYRLNTRDLAAGNSNLPLIIPGGHNIDFYDKVGYRIKSTITP